MARLKTFLKQKRYEEKAFSSPFYYIGWKSYCFLRFLFHTSYRKRILSVWKFKQEYHQFSTYTKKNRYPELFNECKKFFRNRTDLKILSFGCSTGEEVESLGLFLTDASITGVDINKYCIQQCNKKYKHPLWNFIHVSSAEFLNSANYDAVFCLAVFQHPENRYKKNNSSKKYPFSKFEDQLEGLDKKLKPGGLLFIDHSDFSFLQTRVSKKYTVLKTAPNRILRNRPSFDSTNTRIADFSFNYRIFQKSKS